MYFGITHYSLVTMHALNRQHMADDFTIKYMICIYSYKYIITVCFKFVKISLYVSQLQQWTHLDGRPTERDLRQENLLVEMF